MQDMKQENKENKTVPDNYDLKHEAMDALTARNGEQTPDYSEEELKKYRSKSALHIPLWLKMLFIKFWFYGAVCFFFLWGLGTYISSMLDMLFVTGVALGMVMDLLMNNALRFVEPNPGDSDRWIMIRPKGVRSFVLNIVYACVILGCVFLFYNLINYAIITVTGAEDTIPIGVEPLLFGCVCLGFDMLFIGIKRLIVGILRDAKAAARSGQ